MTNSGGTAKSVNIADTPQQRATLAYLGFDLDMPIYKVIPRDQFGDIIRRVQSMVFADSYGIPDPWDFESGSGLPAAYHSLLLIVDAVRPLWKPYRVTQQGLAYDDIDGASHARDWYIGGVAVSKYPDYRPIGYAHMYIATNSLGFIREWSDGVLVQVIPMTAGTG